MSQILSDGTLCTHSHLGRSEYAVLCPTPGTSKMYVEVAATCSRRVGCVQPKSEKYLCKVLNIRFSDKFLSLIKFSLNLRVGLSVSPISPRSGRRHDCSMPKQGTRAHALFNGVYIRVDIRARFRVCPLQKFGTRTRNGD